MWVAFATHIFSAKNIRILYIESTKTVNEMTIKEPAKLKRLWTTGSCFILLLTVVKSVEPNQIALQNWFDIGWHCLLRKTCLNIYVNYRRFYLAFK